MIREIVYSVIRRVWPPHHTAPPELLHDWRLGLSALTLVNAALLALHIVMAMGGTEPYIPGFVRSDQYAQDLTANIESERKRLRGEILRFHVDHCRSTGDLAASYNAQANDLLAEYNKLKGPPIQLPDCSSVRAQASR